MVKITACVIVKNEEENICAWIQNMKKFTKDLVVIDTGSTDRTVQIAAENGANVHSFVWENDFAAAKNFAVEKAGGDWIIFLDADEYFSDESVRNVRRLIEKYHGRRGVDALVCKIVNIDLDSNQKILSEFYNLRIFRNISSLRYVHPVHEMLERADGPLKIYVIPSGVTVYHTGYSANIIQRKLQRNLDILLEQIKAEGEKPWHYRYLSDCYYGMQDYIRAEKYARMHIEDDVWTLGQDHCMQKRIIECMVLQRRGEKEILAEIDAALALSPQDYEILWYKGEYFFQQKRYFEAEKILRAVIDMHREESAPIGFGITTFQARRGRVYYALGTIAEHKGEADSAALYYEQALRIFKYDAQNLAALVRLCCEREELAETLKSIYGEAPHEIKFLRQILKRFPFAPAFRRYQELSKPKEREALPQESESFFPGSNLQMTAQNIRLQLGEDLKQLLALALCQPSPEKEPLLKELLPPFYQREYWKGKERSFQSAERKKEKKMVDHSAVINSLDTMQSGKGDCFIFHQWLQLCTVFFQEKSENARLLIVGYSGTELVHELEKIYPHAVIQSRLPEEEFSGESERFDGIAFFAAFEFVYAPQELLKRMTALLTADGIILASAANISYWKTIKSLLEGAFTAGAQVLAGKHPIRFFARQTLIELLHGARFEHIRLFNKDDALPADGREFISELKEKGLIAQEELFVSEYWLLMAKICR